MKFCFKRTKSLITHTGITILCFAFIPRASGQDASGTFTIRPSLFRYFDYNRVEGMFLGSQLTLSHGSLPWTSLTGRAGYGFESKKLRYAVRLTHAFDLLQRQSLSLTFFDETRSNDSWILNRTENILSNIFLRKDFRDYFRMKGFEAVYSRKLNDNFRISADIGYRKYSSMKDREVWSLFTWDENFRANPQITENNEILLKTSFVYSTRGELFIESNYWESEVVLEQEFNDFTFTGLQLSVRRMLLSFGIQTLIAGIRGGFREGTVDEQYLLDIGGFGSLLAYDFKEFTGTRQLVFDGNYLFNGDILQRIPLQFIPFYSSLSAGIFFGAGLAWFSDKNRRKLQSTDPEYLKHETGSRFSDIRSGAGFSLFLLDEVFTVTFARRFDTSRDPWKFTFRFRLFQNM